MKEYLFIILNRLQQVGVLDYGKFIVPKKEFLNHYREKAKLVMKKQSLDTRDVNLYHILFQPYLHWKEELRIHYANSSDFYYQYSLAQYDVYSYIIIEQFKEEEPKILACVYLPKYWSYMIQSWIIFKVVSKQLTQNSSYCKDPVVIDSQTSNTRIYKRFIPKIIQQKRELPHRDYIAKGRFTKVLGTKFWSSGGDENTFTVQRDNPKARPDFKGYRMVEGIPEFGYVIDGLEIRERLTSKNGELQWHFRINGASTPIKIFAPGGFTSKTGRRDGDFWIVDPDAAKMFTLTLSPSK